MRYGRDTGRLHDTSIISPVWNTKIQTILKIKKNEIINNNK